MVILPCKQLGKSKRFNKARPPLNMTIDVDSPLIFDNLKEQSGNEQLDNNTRFDPLSFPTSNNRSPDLIIAKSNSINDDELWNINVETNIGYPCQKIRDKNKSKNNKEMFMTYNTGFKTRHMKASKNSFLINKNKKKSEIK